ncbi:MAG: tyrosine-type recombinase/integrase [Archaeoglobaceae archaeon]|nr:tyrosine-type recombinase/integrase [Archaeoglobaceae archaeon]
MDIYNFSRQLEREFDLLKKSKIPERNKELICNFQRDLIVEGVKAARIVRYMKTLRIVSERWKPKAFDEWTVDDLKDVLVAIESGDRKYTTETIKEFRKGLRKFFKWLKGENWEGLKILKGDKKEYRLPDVLTEDEVKAMIEAADNLRDKTIIAVIYEAGLRIGELANLQIKDIIWNEMGAKIKVHGKTGERQLLIIMAAPYLKKWLEVHPEADNPNAYVFVSVGTRNHGKPMTYHAFNKVISQAAKKAGIKKRVNPHILRHSRATFLANYLTEAQMNVFFGWTQGSDMPRIYVHLSGRDVDDAIAKVYGMEVEEEKKETKLKPKLCPRCNEINTPTSRFCQKCGLILDERERLQIQFEEGKIIPELMAKILENPVLVDKLKIALSFAKVLENNPQALEKLGELLGSMVND